MPAVLLGLRSALAFTGLLFLFAAAGSYQRFIVWPMVLLRPTRRLDIVSPFMRAMSRSIFAILRAGGARFRRVGQVPTSEPVVILMNHQSLLDVPTVTLMCDPYPPVFVSRRRYSRFVPVVSLSLRLWRCPIIDPEGDRRGAIAILKDIAQAQTHGLLMFPEGHRTRDGEIRPFKIAGPQVLIEARHAPVYLVVTDGYWVSRRAVDFVFNIHKIQGETEVLGPFEPPASASGVPDFIERMREAMTSHLARMRQRREAA